jgi:hypothetical protein
MGFGFPNESIEHLWLKYEILWRAVERQAAASADNAKAITEIETLFASRTKLKSNDENWRQINKTQQLIGCLMDENQLYSHYLELIDLAERLKLRSMTAHEANKQAWFAKLPDGQATPQQLSNMRSTYLFLLTELQASFITRRFERNLRSRTAAHLAKFGLFVLIAGLLPFVIFYVARTYYPDSDIAHMPAGDGMTLGFATLFGLLGAFFSRITRFQSTSEGLTWDTVSSAFKTPIMFLKLISGVFGALIIFFIIRSGLLGGEAFPQFDNMLVSAAKIDGATPGQIVTIMNYNFQELAKLLVWSFIAGFSERLVPDTLVRVEGRSQGTER